MSDNVREITPANLKSVPAMLRYWAKMFESGEEPMPRALLLIAVADDDGTPPQVFSAGEELSHLEEIGAFYSVAQQAGRMVLEPISDPAAHD